MVDVTEQLSQYATRLGDRIEPVELHEIDSKVQERGATGVSMLGLQPPEGRSKRRPVILAAAAAALIVVASVGAFLLIRDDDSTDVVTTPDPGPPTDGATDSATFGYEPGWTELDSGPLDPRKGAATVWTGTEFIVVGGTNHTDGAAYDPRTRTWRTIAEPPLPVGGSMYPSAVWTGDEVLILRRSHDEGMPAPPGFVAYDPSSDSWRRLADPPPVTQPIHSLAWTGSEAILAGASAAYDPGTNTWRSIDLGNPAPDAGMVWTGDRLVLASPGSLTVVYNPETDSTEELGPPPNHGIDSTGGSVGGVVINSDIIIVDQAGRASRLDLNNGAWQEEGDLRTSQSPCIPVGWSFVDGSSVWDTCETMWFRMADGEWSEVGPSRIKCCMRGTVGTDAALLAWVSNDDVANDPDAPHKALWVWVPPEASAADASERTDDHRTGPPPDPNDPTYGYEPGWHDLDPGPLDPRIGASNVWADNALMVLGGMNHTGGAAYDPLGGRWWFIPDPPLEPGWNRDAQFVSIWSEVIVVRPYPDGTAGGPRQALAYNRYNNSWRELPDAPPFGGGPSEFVWTGSEAILVDAAAAFDPATDTWRSLDLPSLNRDAAGVWTGDVLVVAVPGEETLVFDPATDSMTYLDPPPDHGMNIRGGVVGGVATYGRVVIVDAQGRASRLDLATGAWAAEAIVELFGQPCRPEAHALDDGRSVWELCGRTWIRSFHGEWTEVTQAEVGCCLRGSVSTGAFLLNWFGDDDTTGLRAWVPPEAPAPRVLLEDGTHEGFIEQIELGTDRHLVTMELLEYFFGEEAEERAMADGAINEPDGLPNPHYVREVNLPSVLIEAEPEAELWALAQGLSGTNQVTWDEFAVAYNERLAWTEGQVGLFAVEIDVEGGVIVEIRQFYTP